MSLGIGPMVAYFRVSAALTLLSTVAYRSVAVGSRSSLPPRVSIKRPTAGAGAGAGRRGEGEEGVGVLVHQRNHLVQPLLPLTARARRGRERGREEGRKGGREEGRKGGTEERTGQQARRGRRQRQRQRQRQRE
eukprot:3935460-Rhodomonas_salina.3